MHRRVAERFFADRYARLLLSMTVDQAKVILGFPPRSSPTPQEIQKAYRLKALENHPDRGGSNDKMVEVNVAKDVLTKPESSWTPEPSYSPPPRPRPEPPKVVETVSGKKFDAGTSEIPSGVDWKFISKPTYGTSGSRNLPGSYIWTAMGVTDQSYVVASIKERNEDKTYNAEKKGLIEYETDWQCSVMKAPRTKSAAKAILPLIKSTCSMFEDGTSGDVPKKFVLCPEGTNMLTERLIKTIRFGSGGLPFKDVLLASGFVSETDTAMVGRKSVVQMRFEYSRDKEKRTREKGERLYRLSQFDFYVSVNGKECKLEDATVDALGKNFIPWTIGWDAIQDKNVRDLTKLRGGRFKGGAAAALRYLADALTSEPSWLVIALEKAAEEWEPESKTATLLRICSEMPLKEAAEALGRSALSLITEVGE